MLTNTLNPTIRDLVVEDFRTANVFEKYGIDFCCKGNVRLHDVCRDKGIAIGKLEAELMQARAERGAGETRFEEWDPALLSSYIIKVHHGYVRDVTPSLHQHLQKVAAVHGENHPEIRRVLELFEQVGTELSSHMAREERMLFPYINALSVARQTNTPLPFSAFGSVRNPIQMMMSEHEGAGNALAEMRSLTDEYVPPTDACTTYRVSLSELEAFERDLHKHVHLENNILFPRAIAMEEELLTTLS